MATYAQIAQQTFNIPREDGTTRQWRFTFDKKDGSSQSYNVPLAGDFEIIMGDRSDAPNKPFKTHRANFTLQGTGETLMDEIAAAGLRDIRVTIEDTATSTVHFTGYVLPELTSRQLYQDVEQLSVKCYGALADTQEGDGSFTGLRSNFVSIEELAAEIDTAIDLSRELDVYTGLYHDNKAASDPIPEYLTYDVDPAINRDTDGTVLDSLKSVMTALGWQAFQRNGRLVFADLYDRFANSSAINKHEGGGGGGFTNTSEDIEVTLDETNILVRGEQRSLAPVKSLTQRYGMGNRETAAFTDPSPVSDAQGTETDREMDFGLAMEGDVINLTVDGQVEADAPASNVQGDCEFARMELRDYISGSTYYYNNDTVTWVEGTSWGFEEAFAFTGGSGAQTEDFIISNLQLPPAPDGVLAKIILVTACNLTLSLGSASDVDRCNFTDLDVSVTFSESQKAVTHDFKASSSVGIGDELVGATFLGDADLHTDNHAFEYDNGGVWTKTNNWISPTGNGRLSSVVSERAGAVVVGEGVEFTVLVRDTTSIDLLSVCNIKDTDGNTLTCFPVEIRHRAGSGYYRVRLRECFNGVAATSDSYVEGTTDSAGTSSSLGSTGGGLSPEDADARYLRILQDGADINDPATFRSNLGLGAADSPTFGGITVNGASLFDIGSNEFRIRNGTAMFVLDGATGQIGLGGEPQDDIGLHLDTPARAVTANTDYSRLRTSASGALTITASTTSPLVATARFDEPNINLASGAAVTRAATVFISGAPTEGDENYALLVDAGLTRLQDLEVAGTINYVNETNLQVEDKTITVNKNGTDGSADGAGLIVERPSGNHSILWDPTNGWEFSDSLTVAGLTSTGDVTLSGGPQAIKLKSDGTNDHVYQEFYARDASINTRSGLIGYATSGRTYLDIRNEAGSILVRTQSNLSISRDGNVDPTSFTNPNFDDLSIYATSTNAGISIRGQTNGFTGIVFNDSDVTSSSRTNHDGGIYYKHADDELELWVGGDQRITAHSGGLSIMTTSLTSGNVFTVNGSSDFKGDVDFTGNSLLDVGSLFADEFIIDQTSVIGGDQIISVARGKIESINSGASTVDIADPNATGGTQFQANDIFVVEAVDVDGSSIVSADGTVTGVSGTTLTLSFSSGAIGDLSVGDVIVQRGSTSNSARQALIQSTASATGAPYMRFYRNLDAVGDFGTAANIAIQIGTAQDITGYSAPGIFGHDTSGNVAFALNEGKFFYDGMSGSVFSQNKQASFSDNATAGSLTTNEWETSADSTGTGTNSNRTNKVKLRYYHRYGINNLIFSGRVRIVVSSNEVASGTGRTYVEVKDSSGTQQLEDFNQIDQGLNGSSSSVIDLTIDVTSLTADTYYTIEIDGYIEIVGDASNSGAATNEGQMFIREDIFVTTAT